MQISITSILKAAPSPKNLQEAMAAVKLSISRSFSHRHALQGCLQKTYGSVRTQRLTLWGHVTKCGRFAGDHSKINTLPES
jgi:hypothetical protein